MILTNRLFIRPFTERDDEALNCLRRDVINFNKDNDDINTYYKNYPKLATGWLGVFSRQTDKLVGQAGFLARSDVFVPFEPEIACVIFPQHQRSGFAKEVLTALIGWGITEMNLPRFFAGVDTSNPASLKLASSLGLKREGTHTHDNVKHALFWYRRKKSLNNEKFMAV